MEVFSASLKNTRTRKLKSFGCRQLSLRRQPMNLEKGNKQMDRNLPIAAHTRDFSLHWSRLLQVYLPERSAWMVDRAQRERVDRISCRVLLKGLAQ